MSVSIPRGTRDFSQEEMAKRNYIFDTIREVFRVFGYSPIETPSIEKLSTLMGKYGEEGDKLLFKILNSGNYLNKVPSSLLNEDNINKLTTQIADQGLRYDLTVPFARYVVQHRNEITLPFRRSQIQPVWRADRPQKGRYREFYQCDADVVGSTSLLNEAELIKIIDLVFERLNVSVTVLLNNRKILSGIAQVMEQSDKVVDITVAIDKIDKIGLDEVKKELREKGISNKQIEILEPILKLEGDYKEKLETINKVFAASEIGKEGVKELIVLFDYLSHMGIKQKVELNLSLARGLNYYTGTIIEVKANDFEIGSICGGGRYDNLTEVFGMKGVPGVGISFGADRIYDVLNGLNLYPNSKLKTTKILFTNMGAQEELYSLSAIMELREKNVPCEIYPDECKLKKQLDYANKRNIPFVCIIGEKEINSNLYTLRDMNNQTQIEVNREELIAYFA